MSTRTYQRRNREAKRISVALLLSLLIHLLFVTVVAVWASLAWNEPETPPEDAPVEITFIDPPAPSPAATPYVRTNPDQAVEQAPEQAQFESDLNTRAASELPGSDNTPLPSMEGQEQKTLEFQNQQSSLGPQTASARPAPATPPTPPTPQTPTDQPVEVTEISEDKPTATPKPTPLADLAMLEPPQPKTRPKPTPPRPEDQTRPPQPATPPGYQPETRTTRLRGGLSNRGRAAVDARATPLGRYKKMLSDAIGSRWYYYVNQQMGLLSVGTVEIRFTVQPSGKVEGVRVLSNSSNESFATCSVRSIIEAEIPPIPPEVAAVLEGGRIEIDYTFTIMSN